jgi:pimeloyl-ACP methyl ester carboxylesterase
MPLALRPTDLGRIYEDGSASTPPELRWFSSILEVIRVPGVTTHGHAATLNEATANFRGNWRRCQIPGKRLLFSARNVSGGEIMEMHQVDPAFIEMEELLRELLPNLETVRIPKINHLLCLQEPQPVAEALARFFAKHQLT